MSKSSEQVYEALVKARAMRERFHALATRSRNVMVEAQHNYSHTLRLLDQADALVKRLEEVE